MPDNIKDNKDSTKTDSPKSTVTELNTSQNKAYSASGQNTTHGTNKPSTGTGTATGQTSQSDLSDQASRKLDDLSEWGSETLNQAQETFKNAYDQASQSVNDGLQQARDYGRENPGKSTLIAFGIGVGVGLLLASNYTPHSRARRILPPVMNALTEIADEFFR